MHRPVGAKSARLRVSPPKPVASRRCLKGVDSRSKRSPEFISIDKQPQHEIMHAYRLGKHPLEGSCQEATLLPCATFDDFFLLRSLWHTPLPTCGRRRVPVFLRVVSAVSAPHQAPIRINASDVSLLSQTSAPGTVGAPENRQFPALSKRLLLTNAMAPMRVPFAYGSRQRRRQTPQSGRRLSGMSGGQDESNRWL